MVRRAKPRPSKRRSADHVRTPRAARGAARAADAQLYDRVAQILEQARGQVARTINTGMVQAYWLIGREIVEVEQAGEARAGYGEEVIDRLAQRLREAFGKGFSVQNLRYMRQFYLAFPTGSKLPEIHQALPGESREGGSRQALPAGSTDEIRQAVPGESHRTLFPPALGWTHYVILMRVANPTARAFYEIEAAREAWSTRELERQIGALLFDRIVRHRDPEAVLALARRGQEVSRPDDVIKDPFVLEFLDLHERTDLHERDVSRRSSIASRRSCSRWARASASSPGRSG